MCGAQSDWCARKGEAAELIEGPTKSGRERVVDLDQQTAGCICDSGGWRGPVSILGLARDDALVFGTHRRPAPAPGAILTSGSAEAVARCSAPNSARLAPPAIPACTISGHTATRPTCSADKWAGEGGL